MPFPWVSQSLGALLAAGSEFQRAASVYGSARSSPLHLEEGSLHNPVGSCECETVQPSGRPLPCRLGAQLWDCREAKSASARAEVGDVSRQRKAGPGSAPPREKEEITRSLTSLGSPDLHYSCTPAALPVGGQLTDREVRTMNLQEGWQGVLPEVRNSKTS